MNTGITVIKLILITKQIKISNKIKKVQTLTSVPTKMVGTRKRKNIFFINNLVTIDNDYGMISAIK